MKKMKTKILFVIDNLMAGGVSRALINMVNEICKEYDIYVLAFSYSGLLKKQLSKDIHIVETNKFLNLLGESQKQIGKRSFFQAAFRAFLVLCCKLFTNKIPHRLLFSSFKQHNQYDVAISYIHDHDERSLARGCNRFVIEKIEANKKIAFVHSDFINYGGNTKRNRKIYYSFDEVVCVSEGCKRAFEACFEKKLKVSVVRNFVNYQDILALANQKAVVYSPKEISVVSVARLSKEKGFERGLIALSKILNEQTTNIHWYIIGDGPEYNNVLYNIESEHLNSVVTLVGQTDNPYRYLKNADYLLLISFHECAPMVFDEAYALGLTILTTKTLSTNEMILDKKIGYVFDNSQDGVEKIFFGLINNTIKKISYVPTLCNDLPVSQFSKIISK